MTVFLQQLSFWFGNVHARGSMFMLEDQYHQVQTGSSSADFDVFVRVLAVCHGFGMVFSA
jgi:hypothetical protein